jgi:HAD superfamily hydrolase (TIGR01484 family)
MKQPSEAPLPLSRADFSKVRAVFTDVDGTLTTRGLLTSAAVRAIEWLVAHDVKVVLVSGRPSAWGELWARELPVAGAIVENGGLYFVHRKEGALTRVYAEPQPQRAKNRKRLEALVKAALKAVPGARMSSDSIATEVDLAIDYAEDAKLGPVGADKIERFLHARGVTAVRSSVHVNCWLGNFDKASMVRRFLRREWGLELKKNDPRFVYVGDSFNDAPLFKAFGLSVGVANVADVLATIDHPPRFITRGREGKGFGEVADAATRGRR